MSLPSISVSLISLQLSSLEEAIAFLFAVFLAALLKGDSEEKLLISVTMDPSSSVSEFFLGVTF